MNDKDMLQKFLFEQAAVRGEVVHLHETIQTILQQHSYPKILQELLSEALVLASLLTASIKFKGRLTIQFQGTGKIKLLLVQSNTDLKLRGLIQWNGEINSDDMLLELKKGTLAIIVDPDDNVSGRYQGIVAFEGNSLTQSIEAYFKYSEQLPTRLWVTIKNNHAAGLLLQVLPEEKQDKDNDDWTRLIYLTETIKPDELLTLENRNLLYRLFSEEDIRLFEPIPVSFSCTCSVQRGENAILMLGQEEAELELIEKQKIVVTCEFCNKEYIFGRVEVDAIFKNNGKHTLH
ncbi:MAG: Hsp33 family molecular chaperone HslO [Gammaproteobacteria bacterium]|nr:Hsp33 family molecular chaperone HslO [Gammaproteobacteria bacterium]